MQQETQAEIDQEEADFQAELANESYDDVQPPSEQQPAAETNEPEPKEADQEVVKVERIEVIPGYTKEELDNVLTEVPKLRAALDKTNGTYGSRLAEQQKLIDELKARAAQPSATAESAEVKQLKLEHMRESYPELADILAKDLSGVGAQQSGIDPAIIDAAIKSRLDEDRQARATEALQREARLLKREHPDYEDIAKYTTNENGLIQWNNPAFGNWLASQAREVQDVIINSNDAYAISDVLTSYKTPLKKKKPNDLENAVQPKGLPSSRSVDHLDDEERAYQEELAKEDY